MGVSRTISTKYASLINKEMKENESFDNDEAIDFIKQLRAKI